MTRPQTAGTCALLPSRSCGPGGRRIVRLVAVQERRAEVMSLVECSNDAADAAQRLVGLLQLEDAGHALAVLDMQVRRCTRQDRLRLQQERDELRATLGGRL